jgi:hypothetical protein
MTCHPPRRHGTSRYRRRTAPPAADSAASLPVITLVQPCCTFALGCPSPDRENLNANVGYVGKRHA